MGWAVFMSVPAPIYSNECELVIMRLNLTNSTFFPDGIEYGINSLKVTVEKPVTDDASESSLTVNNIGSISTTVVAPPLI